MRRRVLEYRIPAAVTSVLGEFASFASFTFNEFLVTRGHGATDIFNKQFQKMQRNYQIGDKIPTSPYRLVVI